MARQFRHAKLDQSGPGFVHAWYPGENGGQALGEILFGKLTLREATYYHGEAVCRITRPPRIIQPKATRFTIQYTEGIFVGYRGYEENHIQPQFLFGFGLSYTTFAYSDLKIAPPQLNGNNHVKVSFTVTNTGNLAGAEIAELYVGQQNPPHRPAD